MYYSICITVYVYVYVYLYVYVYVSTLVIFAPGEPLISAPKISDPGTGMAVFQSCVYRWFGSCVDLWIYSGTT